MNEAEYQQLVEKGLRRKLDPGEEIALEAYLATRPELRAAWEEEQGLNHLLQQLPNAPLASNFTAQVWDAAERETRAEARSSFLSRLRQLALLRWMRPAAMACVLAVVGIVSFQQVHRGNNRAEQMAVTMQQLTQVPSVAALMDFEAINRLSQASHFVDVDLLTLPE